MPSRDGRKTRSRAGPSRAFPPDRPPTESYEIYPRFHIVPFHFDHPVTGRPPQYPEGTKVPVRPASASRTAGLPVKTAAALASLSRDGALRDRSKAYHASENLATAYGYYIDEFAWDETRTSSRATAGRSSRTSAPTSAGSGFGSR
jgi:hypothetical protein